MSYSTKPIWETWRATERQAHLLWQGEYDYVEGILNIKKESGNTSLQNRMKDILTGKSGSVFPYDRIARSSSHESKYVKSSMLPQHDLSKWSFGEEKSALRGFFLSMFEQNSCRAMTAFSPFTKLSSTHVTDSSHPSERLARRIIPDFKSQASPLTPSSRSQTAFAILPLHYYLDHWTYSRIFPQRSTSLRGESGVSIANRRMRAYWRILRDISL